MKLNTFIYLLLTAFVAVSCSKNAPVFEREHDFVSVDCNEQTIEEFLRCNGEWTSDCSACPWISIFPESGSSDGIKYERYAVSVDYNAGAAREGYYYLIANGARYAVIISQAKCSFSYTSVDIDGELVLNMPSSANIKIAYTGASGLEKINFSAKLSSDAAAGLSVESQSITLIKGEAAVYLPIKGTPSKTGNVECEVYANGVAIGNFTTSVTSTVSVSLASWQFADAADAAKKSELDAKYPEWATSHYIPAMTGSGKLSVVEKTGKTQTAVNSFSFSGGHAYMKGMYLDDYFLFTVNAGQKCKAGSKFTFTGSMGGSGSSAGFFICEYSIDGGASWVEAEAVQSFSCYTGDTVYYHARPEDDTTGSEKGAYKVVFVTGKDASSADVLIRLRVSANVRLTNNNTITTGGGGSTRFKGKVEVVAIM